MLRALKRLLGLGRRSRLPSIQEPRAGEELTPWGRWLTAQPGRRILIASADEDDQQTLVQQHLRSIGGSTALLVDDGVVYSFARDWPGRPGQVLLTFGTMADVVDRTWAGEVSAPVEDDDEWAEPL
jgi:hypothetical protein